MIFRGKLSFPTENFSNDENEKLIKILEQYKAHASSKRTTIYLPTNIPLTKPTYEINHKLDILPTLLQIAKNHEQYIDLYKNYFFHFKNQEHIKPYQIIIEEKHWLYINNIRELTGAK